MNFKKSALLSLATITALASGTAFSASADLSKAEQTPEPRTTVNVNGGTWDYGYTTSTAYSKYIHSYNKHGAKVVNQSTGKVGKANANPGAWASASVGRNIIEKGTFYYNPTGFY